MIMSAQASNQKPGGYYPDIVGHITTVPRDISSHMYALVLMVLMGKNVWIQVSTNVQIPQGTANLYPMGTTTIRFLDVTNICTVQLVITAVTCAGIKIFNGDRCVEP
jgi:hypothetical protein